MNSALNLVLGLFFALTTAASAANAQEAPATPKAKKSAKKAATKPATTETAPSAAAGAGSKVAPGEVLNFRIDEASMKEKASSVPMIQFKEEGESLTPTAAETYNDSVSDDAPFRTYVGYPKHRLSALVVPKSVAATWSQGGQDFNFRSNSLGYGVAYDLVSTPRFAVGFEYTHAELKMDEAKTGSGVGGRQFQESKAGYDIYYAKMRYCFFGSSSFFQQICPGFDIGNDAYPVLSWVSGTKLKLDRLQDIVAGLNLTYQSPITDRLLFRSTAGYNHGLGIGSSGSVTSKSNSSYYLKIGTGFDFNPRHGMGLDVFWNNRTTKLKDKTDTVDETWDNKATELGVRVAYTFTL
ncbi:MAG: hypothetical protein KF799_11370 [Bdellovibrionales bacterium]|nr:hypothetical protein [Bdellovibrionales bacterium]